MLVLDTSAIINFLAGGEAGEKVHAAIKDNTVGMTAFSVKELLYGARNERDIESYNQFLNSVTIFNFDRLAAERAALLEHELERKGKIMEQSDAFIASICLSHDLEFLTFDKDFERVPGLKLKLLK